MHGAIDTAKTLENRDRANPDVIVIGGGLVGLCCALSLQERGRRVVIVERDVPGGKASRWNAGVWATSSLVPMVNPALPRRLPALLFGRAPGVRIDPRVLPTLLAWLPMVLRNCRPGAFAQAVAALGALIAVSRDAHERRLTATGATHLRRPEGWLHLHRTKESLDDAIGMGPLYDRHGVANRVFGPAELAMSEPWLSKRYAGAVWFAGSAAITDPAALFAAYLSLFQSRGGEIRSGSPRTLRGGGTGWEVGGADLRAPDVVVAAGPWSSEVLSQLGLRLPMFAERGTMRRYALADGATLRRPVFDAAAGVVLSPRPGGVQISTGTFLTRPGSSARSGQWAQAIRAAASIVPLADPLDDALVTADRPTLPDWRPAIGAVPGRPGLWLCCGHQHIGFSTSAGSGEMLADLVCGTAPDPRLGSHLDAFDPTRFPSFA